MLRLLLVFIFVMFFAEKSLAQEVEFSNTQNLKSFMRELGTKTRALAKIRSEKVEKLDKQYKSRLKEINAAAVRELELMQKRVASENLDKALEIREAAKSIGIPKDEETTKEEPPLEQDKKENEGSEKPISFLFLVENFKGSRILWTLLSDGRAFNRYGQRTWSFDGNQVSLDSEDGSLWKLTPSKDGNYSAIFRDGKTASFKLLYGSPEFFKK